MISSHNEERSRLGSILVSRSRSFSPRARRRREASQSPSPRPQRRLLPPSEPKTSTMGSLVKSWILTPTMTQTSNKLLLPKIPILTMLMIRLEETLPLYCQRLENPTMENAAAAASLLDNKGTAALSSPGNSVNSSPASPATGSTSKALQSCWETYTSPFLLLAAAEALYAQERTPKLIALYVKIANDLTVVEQILCDPVLGSTESLHHATATSLTQHLVKLREWTSMRCQLLELILQAPSSLEQVLPGLQTLWLDVASRPSADDDMTKALQTEVQLWLWLIEACWHLQDCRYVPIRISFLFALNTVRNKVKFP
jgi:hypothetical protein